MCLRLTRLLHLAVVPLAVCIPDCLCLSRSKHVWLVAQAEMHTVGEPDITKVCLMLFLPSFPFLALLEFVHLLTESVAVYKLTLDCVVRLSRSLT
jgi:hypothetical protein